MPAFPRPSKTRVTALGLCALALFATSCSSTSSAQEDVTPKAVVDNYANGVHASYVRAANGARAMDSALDRFTANPTEESLKEAKRAWLSARPAWGETEAFRFYGGPIDNEETGKEGLINAWPLDEAYLDYVTDKADAGVINNPGQYPTIDKTVITELNEKDGEANISTGWHAIEFLLWGQDLSETGAGDRKFTDYTTAPNADRRKMYLATTSDLLLEHIDEVVAAWAPNSPNYRAEFTSIDPNEAVRRMVTGIGEFSKGELAGERMSVAFLDRSQEDEHSCFSDNTTADMVANAESIRHVVEGDYGNGVTGPGFADLVATKDEKLAQRLRTEVQDSAMAVRSIPDPFDQHLRAGVAEDDPGRATITRSMTALETQADTIVAGAGALGITVNVA